MAQRRKIKLTLEIDFPVSTADSTGESPLSSRGADSLLLRADFAHNVPLIETKEDLEGQTAQSSDTVSDESTTQQLKKRRFKTQGEQTAQEEQQENARSSPSSFLVIGDMQRGSYHEGPDDDDPPREHSFCFWGTLCLVGLPPGYPIITIGGISVVDNVSPGTYCVRLDEWAGFAVISPCVAPSSHLYHFHRQEPLVSVSEAVDTLYRVLPDSVDIFLMARLCPLQLIRFPRRSVP